MRDKYARQDFNSYNLMHKPADSSLWKAIVALWPYLVDGEYWAVGKSDSVSVWYDRWISADIIKLSNVIATAISTITVAAVAAIATTFRTITDAVVAVIATTFSIITIDVVAAIVTAFRTTIVAVVFSIATAFNTIAVVAANAIVAAFSATAPVVGAIAIEYTSIIIIIIVIKTLSTITIAVAISTVVANIDFSGRRINHSSCWGGR